MFKPNDPSTAACPGHKLKDRAVRMQSNKLHIMKRAQDAPKGMRQTLRAPYAIGGQSTWEGGGMALAWACRGGCSLATTSLAFPDDTYIVKCVLAFSPMC